MQLAMFPENLTIAEIEYPVDERAKLLLPAGVPRWLRIYDNGGVMNPNGKGSADRYTIVFTGRYQHKTMNEQWFVTSSSDPFWPQGIYLHGEFQGYWSDKEKRKWQWGVDRPVSSHLGKRIKWDDLPKRVQDAVLCDYMYLWDIGPGNESWQGPSVASAREFQARLAREMAA